MTISVVVKEDIMNLDGATVLEDGDMMIPDVYEIVSNGHWVDVNNSTYDKEKIRVHFTSPKGKEVYVDITAKEAAELRKELKAAITLVLIADDF